MVSLAEAPSSQGQTVPYQTASSPLRCLSAAVVLVQRIHELATERHEYRDEERTVNFALGCLLGELSGQLFPLTHDEHERIQREDRQFLAEDEAQRAEMSQERKTEPLDTTVLQEA